jgi:hypothetical protein
MDHQTLEFSLSPGLRMQHLNFLCWKWRPVAGYRSKFDAATVNTLHSMIGRHYRGPWRLICVTDDPAGIIPEVETVPLWTDFSNIPSPHGRMYPSCYRRLKMFSKEAAAMFGPRFVSIDLDVVITADITPLFDLNGVDFKMYGDTAIGTPYNGSLIYHRAGTRTQLWEKFSPASSPQIGIKMRFIGSDQAWIGACLGPNEPKFTRRDGVYSYRNEILPKGGALPKDARIVIMHGHHDPWCPKVQLKHAWLREHYR